MTLTVAKAHLLSFEEYATKATSKLTLEIDPSEFNTEQINKVRSGLTVEKNKQTFYKVIFNM